ncbi:glutamyl-tRNA reductase [Francisella frigiditurris]|uniref:Glutamyl-tRNA reductase n=1 Tax=Francisella frigiditurris TaxID=1542390 RepID=A0A1J0KSM0_9GAMM|nr:glutamyl-tRNA reductase [Francisella frigiditurris]APC96690.1 glutamyl-tRNA reductase [Francisella frigiditurris]
MALVSLAIDYKKASVEVRSLFALNHNDSRELYSSILEIENIEHAVFISTCNRTELYLEISELRVVDEAIAWWQSKVKTTKFNLKDYIKLRQGTEVIKHLMKLACGLESMVLGEPQILGQVKSSYSESKQNNALGKELDRVFQKVFATAKKVRRETKIGYCPVSVAFSAISLAKRQLDNISEKTVLIIGAGETGELLFKHINSLEPEHIYIANRTIERADNITKNFSNATSFNLDNIANLVNKADIIVAAVTFSEYIIKSEEVDSIKERVFIDISIPRVIEPEIKNLENSVYYSIDDIQSVMEDSRDKRLAEAKRATKIIEKSLEEYIAKERAIVSNEAIKELFDKASNMVDSEIEKSLAKLKNGKDAEDVLRRFAYDIQNKVLHYPVKGMKKATRDGRDDCFMCMKRMFGLN